MDNLSETMEHVETIRKYREHYKYHKEILMMKDFQKSILQKLNSIQ